MYVNDMNICNMMSMNWWECRTSSSWWWTWIFLI